MTATLRLYTDFVCPFCFIAEESTVPRLLRELDLVLEWHGFELHPDTPPGGRPLASLFPGANLPRLHEGTKRFAASFGVTDFDPPNVLRNTRRALAVAELARDRGVLMPFRRAVFEAHWRQGKNIEDVGELAAIATTVAAAAVAGARLDADEVVAAADDPRLLARVDQRQEAARAAGVRGIPTFVFVTEKTRATVVGCQPFAALADAATRAGVAVRSGPPGAGGSEDA